MYFRWANRHGVFLNWVEKGLVDWPARRDPGGRSRLHAGIHARPGARRTCARELIGIVKFSDRMREDSRSAQMTKIWHLRIWSWETEITQKLSFYRWITKEPCDIISAYFWQITKCQLVFPAYLHGERCSNRVNQLTSTKPRLDACIFFTNC